MVRGANGHSPSHGSEPPTGVRPDAQAEQVIDISVQHPSPGTAVIRVHGEIDALTVPVLAKEVQRQLASKPRSLVIDLRQVSFLDSLGLAMLVDAHRIAHQIGIAIRLLAITQAVIRPIESSGLRELLQPDDGT